MLWNIKKELCVLQKPHSNRSQIYVTLSGRVPKNHGTDICMVEFKKENLEFDSFWQFFGERSPSPLEVNGM